MSPTCDRRKALGLGAAAAVAFLTPMINIAAEETSMNEADLQPLLRALDEERQRWIEGRFQAPTAGPMLQAPDMTIFGPFGGDAGPVGPDLVDRQKRASSVFHGGSGRSELVRSYRGGDLLVLVINEFNEVKFEERPAPHAWNLRTTQVFRRDGDRWIRLHRHADPLTRRRSLEGTLDLIDLP